MALYRINIKKSVSFLYCNNELREKESRKEKFLWKTNWKELLEINLTKKRPILWKLYNSVGNWRWYYKEVERYSVLTDWKNQYS